MNKEISKTRCQDCDTNWLINDLKYVASCPYVYCYYCGDVEIYNHNICKCGAELQFHCQKAVCPKKCSNAPCLICKELCYVPAMYYDGKNKDELICVNCREKYQLADKYERHRYVWTTKKKKN